MIKRCFARNARMNTLFVLWDWLSMSALSILVSFTSTSSLSISNYSRAACPRTASSSMTKQCGVVHFPTSISGAENWKIMSLSPLTSGALHALFAVARGGGGFNRREKKTHVACDWSSMYDCRIKLQCIIDAIRSRNRGFGSP